MSNKPFLKQREKGSLTWIPLFLALITVLVAAAPTPPPSPPVRHKGSAGFISSQPVSVSNVAAPQAAQGNPIDLTIDTTQDQAISVDQSDAALSTLSASGFSSGTVRRGFASISLETDHVCNFLLDANLPKMTNIYKNLGTGGTMRVGGFSADVTGWDSLSTRPCPTASLEDTPTMTPPMVQKLFQFAHSIGWRVIWTIGLPVPPAQAADEAAVVVNLSQQIGQGFSGPLLALAFMNEPELDLPGDNPTYAQFRAAWEAEISAIKARVPYVAIEGPDTCCTDNDQWFTSFMQDDGRLLQIAGNHLYPTNADNNPTNAQILSPALRQRMLDWIDRLHQASSGARLPLELTETNSQANSPNDNGMQFDQSLWTADYLFFAQEHGVVGLNFHGGVPGDATSPTHGDDQGFLTVQATYYGMLFFHQAAAVGGHIVPIKAPPLTDSFNLAAHAIRGRDGKLYIALINKGAQDYALLVHSGRLLPQKAQALRMTAPSVDSENITVGGATIKGDGSWSANQLEPLPVINSTASITVPAYSAALVIFSPA